MLGKPLAGRFAVVERFAYSLLPKEPFPGFVFQSRNFSGFGRPTLKHEDVEPIALYPVTSSNGEVVFVDGYRNLRINGE